MNFREIKGKEIANRTTITQDGNLWLVPSQSGKGKYKVNTLKQTCSCPDYDFRKQKCKHLYAVEIIIERTKTTTVEDGKTTVTETVKVTRKTYAQVWPAYIQQSADSGKEALSIPLAPTLSGRRKSFTDRRGASEYAPRRYALYDGLQSL